MLRQKIHSTLKNTCNKLPEPLLYDCDPCYCKVTFAFFKSLRMRNKRNSNKSTVSSKKKSLMIPDKQQCSIRTPCNICNPYYIYENLILTSNTKMRLIQIAITVNL